MSMDAASDPPPPDLPAPPYEAALHNRSASTPDAADPHAHQRRRSPPPRDTKANVMDIDQVVTLPPLLAHPPHAKDKHADFSVEDLEVARALTGLRDVASEPPHPAAWREPTELRDPASPAQSTATLMSATFALSPRPAPLPATPAKRQPEPLLSLLTSQHPLIASTINNSISAYSSGKTYSSRFRQGAEFVERNIASPVASTVGTAGRISGVETGVRWMLRRTASGTSGEGPEGGNKRRKLDPDAMDTEQQHTPLASPDAARLSRASSDLSQHEFLPAYDDNRSPVYEELAVVPQDQALGAYKLPQNWQTRLMVTTSGLGVAMSDESLRSLKYCLSWLRWASGHLNRVMASLQSVLQEWEDAQHAQLADGPNSPPLSPSARPRDPAAIAQSLTALRAECVKTLRGALEVVSTYAGGALPENARDLVRKHLTSLPLRFQLATKSRSRAGSVTGDIEAQGGAEDDDGGAPEAVSGARRVAVLAREGLDMMAQVGAVVDGTINSAEEWCQRLGRRRDGDGDADVSEKTALAEQQLQSMTVGEQEEEQPEQDEA